MTDQVLDIPSRADIVVIGGGPGGSSAAGYLTQKGFDVVLLDKVTHPRPQVGESLIPHIWKLADNLGVSSKIAADGFLPKAGGVVSWDGHIHLMRFSDFGYEGRSGLHVERDRFDEVLLRHTQSLGARVFEDVIVRSVDVSDGAAPRVTYEDRRGGRAEEGTIACRWVIDASGPSALLARQFNTRRFVKTDLKFLGLWGYFKDSRYFGIDGNSYPAERCREVKPVTFVSSYEDGWAWHIVLRDQTSVGFVMNTDKTKGMNKEEQEAYFLQTCRSLPYLRELLANATFVPGSMSFRPDYSYYNERFVGDGFMCVGDAAAFVDPIFSQGVLTGMFHASLASWAIEGLFQNPARRDFYMDVYRNRVLQYYGFSRLLAFGDFGGENIDPGLVRQIVKSLPQNELELSFAASYTTMRADNLRRMIREAGLDDSFLHAKVKVLEALHP